MTWITETLLLALVASIAANAFVAVHYLGKIYFDLRYRRA